ncbi:MAG: ATPase, T2SS/T4P/T4SS family [Candidatus Brocadiia bacterium]
MAEKKRKQLGQILKEMEIVTEKQIQDTLTIQKQKGGAIGRIFVQLGYATEGEVLLALGAQVGMDVVILDEVEIKPDVIEKVPASMAKVFKIIPIKWENNTLTVAMANPLNLSVLDDLKFMLSSDVKGAVSDEASVNRALEKYYTEEETLMDSVLKELGDTSGVTSSKDKALSLDNIQQMADQAPVKKLLSLILLHAIKDQAADIHFEPFEKEFKIRYRVDGVLYEMVPPPLNLALPLISRIKVLANMNIAETRLPQDNRIALNVGGKPIDVRVSTLPTMYGESVVMRILNREVVSLDLENMGIRDDDLKQIKNILSLPHGVFIVTGPTGSGKTTTLYGCLNYLNDVKWKIITTEDPVEYDLPGIVQCPINENIGVTYGACLRAILRQDPDTILVGEIRDQETARMAIEAALTGHQVMTTLHTNDAPSTIARILDLGVEPYLIMATLEAIIAQRLVRKICTKCKEEIEPTEEMLRDLNLSREEVEGKKFYAGKRCPACNNTGYKGRMALFEILLVNEKIKQMVLENVSVEKIRMAAREHGMRTLRENGLLAIYDGQTTAEEVIRETLSAESA